MSSAPPLSSEHATYRLRSLCDCEPVTAVFQSRIRLTSLGKLILEPTARVEMRAPHCHGVSIVMFQPARHISQPIRKQVAILKTPSPMGPALRLGADHKDIQGAFSLDRPVTDPTTFNAPAIDPRVGSRVFLRMGSVHGQ